MINKGKGDAQWHRRVPNTNIGIIIQLDQYGYSWLRLNYFNVILLSTLLTESGVCRMSRDRNRDGAEERTGTGAEAETWIGDRDKTTWIGNVEVLEIKDVGIGIFGAGNMRI